MFKRKITTAALAILMATTVIPPTSVHADQAFITVGDKTYVNTNVEAKTLLPTIVDDIRTASNVSSVTEQWTENDDYMLYQFTAEHPGIFRISLSGFGLSKSGSGGSITSTVICKDKAGTQQIVDGTIGAVPENGSISKDFYLEAGTYYVKAMRDFKSTTNRASGIASISVVGQYTNVTTRPTSYEAAQVLSNEMETKGFFSSEIHDQYYKLVLSKDAIVTINHRAMLGLDSSSSGKYQLILCNKNHKELLSWENSQNNLSEEHTVKLKKGTYYLVMRDSSKQFRGETELLTQIKYSDITAPSKPIVGIPKSGATKISGKAEKYSTVTVSINGNEYSSKATSKGVYWVKVPALATGTKVTVTATDKAGNTSEEKIVTVI